MPSRQSDGGDEPQQTEAPIRIVIAEDHAFVQEGTRRLLDMEPDMHVIGVAPDGVEAIEIVERLDPTLVLMDISMPRMDGIEATRRIRAMKPELPILILSAYDDDQYVFALVEAGAAGYLLKDIRREELVDAIRSVSRGESVLHPTIARKVMQRFGGYRGDQQSATDTLTEREVEVLRLAAGGAGNDAIALELGVSARTVQSHLSNVFAKLGVGSRTQAVIAALRQGLIRLEEIE
jgi:two-component system, NarL family, response regulator LiaR